MVNDFPLNIFLVGAFWYLRDRFVWLFRVFYKSRIVNHDNWVKVFARIGQRFLFFVFVGDGNAIHKSVFSSVSFVAQSLSPCLCREKVLGGLIEIRWTIAGRI